MHAIDGQQLHSQLSTASRWDRLGLPYLVERGGLDLDRTAIVFDGRTRTYGELRERVRRVALGLAGIGIEPMDRVALLSTNSLEYLEIEIGISAARGIMVPLNWRLRSGELANLLRRSGAQAILVEDRFLATVHELRRSGEVPELRTIIGLGEKSGDLGYEELCAAAGGAPPRPAPTSTTRTRSSSPRGRPASRRAWSGPMAP